MLSIKYLSKDSVIFRQGWNYLTEWKADMSSMLNDEWELIQDRKRQSLVRQLLVEWQMNFFHFVFDFLKCSCVYFSCSPLVLILLIGDTTCDQHLHNNILLPVMARIWHCLLDSRQYCYLNQYQQHQEFSSSLSYKNCPGPMLLNFSGQMGIVHP